MTLIESGLAAGDKVENKVGLAPWICQINLAIFASMIESCPLNLISQGLRQRRVNWNILTTRGTADSTVQYGTVAA